MPDIPRSLTPRELAARWRCRVKRVREMIRAGTLAAFEIDGRQRIAPEAIAAAEAGPLAVRPAKRRVRPSISKEVADLLNG